MHASVIALLALVAVAAAQPQFAAAPVPIINHELVRDDFNQYALRYQTGDGASFADHGKLVPGPEGHVLVRSGSHAYRAPDGRVITLSYTADENGYHPTGDHLPVSVPAQF
ncbi:pupal cuticle protein 20-like [Thrips palmi]|uniref:Pupal cuticle protein 20-like n=1 Tax=Thrips palmi TaxID=161013 RepID=A0A6P8YHJ5_THRPL|nr:pupal cuticle protein 20-like [Thrips palmi]